MARIVAEADALEESLNLLRAGGVAAIPTETVYGLAADATNGDAVARIFEIKGRPRFNPLICHVSDLAMARTLAEFGRLATGLAERFWPGPLTLVLPRAPNCPAHPLVSAGLDTVALRMPVGFSSKLIARFGRPLAAPSANTSGRVSATTAMAVERDLGDKIDLIVDAGPSPIGLESTIVKIEEDSLRLLRPGGIPVEDIEAAAGIGVARHHGGSIEAPGMLASHYATAAPIRLNARHVESDEALLAFGPDRATGSPRVALNLSPTADLREAAANLFTYLRRLDGGEIRCIAVEPVPEDGLGAAINDRLCRAAAPRATDTEDTMVGDPV